MRYLRYAFLLVLAIILISVSVANRGMVELRLLPRGVAEVPGMSAFDVAVTLPLFVVILLGIGAGLVIGFLWEWMREHKHRREANVKTREVQKLEREVGRLKKKTNPGQDEILNILENAR